MNVLWHKIWYDLWRNKLRTLLVVISIAVGVFAVGATFGMVEQMLPTMDAAHQSTTPSHATMYISPPVDEAVLRSLLRVPGVAGVEGMNDVEMRYKLSPEDSWHKGIITARADYSHQTYDIVQLREGQWPKGRTLAIERMHSPWYGVFIGSQVIVEVGDQPHSFPVTGIIRHPFVPPPSMYDLAFFFSDGEVMEMFGVPPDQYTQIKLSVLNFDPQYVRLVASAVKDRLAQQGVGVNMTMYQDPQKHWGRFYIEGMSLVIQVLAVLSLLLSAVLVMNTLTAVITQQTNQIGILKAIGGSSYTITGLYLTGVLVYGLLALGMALPLGMLASFTISRTMLGLYNIEYDTFVFSYRVMAVQSFSALLAPLLAGLLPVWNGARISVRQAIASYGVGGDFGSTWLDRLIERVGRRLLASYNAMALANTFRRKGRLVLTQLVLVTAGVMFMLVMGLSSSLTATLDAEYNRRAYDLLIYFDDVQRVDRMTALAESVPGVEQVGMWCDYPVTVLLEGHKTLDAGMGSSLKGVPLDDPMYIPPIVAGRWLQPGDHFAVVMERQVAEDEGIRVGDTVNLDMGPWGQHNWQVVGLYQVNLMSTGGYSISAIYAPRPAVFEASKKTNRARTLVVRTRAHSLDDVNQVMAGLEDAFDRYHIEMASTETMAQSRLTADASFGIITWMLLVLAALVAVVGGIGLMGSLWISVIERTKEIGILRAIGAVSSRIIGMFMLEGLIQGVMSWLIAVPIALLAAPSFASALGQVMFGSDLDFAFNWGAVLAWLGIVVFLSVLAASIPARSAAQINVRQSLSYE